MSSFILAAAIQLLQYTVLTINFRAIANQQYFWAWATSVGAAFLSYTIVKRVTKDETWATVLGMMCGGGLGDLTGIYITRHWG